MSERTVPFVVSWRRMTDELESCRITAPSRSGAGRLLSLDVLRGFDMVWIIGGKRIIKGLHEAVDAPWTSALFAQFDHAEWTGMTFYDIIMPLFLFLVGASMVFSLSKRRSSGDALPSIWRHIITRVAILWILGMVVQGRLLTYDLGQIRFYSNTLQAIASGYLIAALFVLHLPVRWQIASTAGLLGVYAALFALVPGSSGIPGDFSPQTNIALALDTAVLGIHQDGTTYTWILSSLTFGATTMLGVFSAYLLRSRQNGLRISLWLLLSGGVLMAAAQIFSLWHPIIKHLWTSTFVLYSGGICIIMLSVVYWLVDVVGVRFGTRFFVVIGSNAIAAYVSYGIFDYRLIGNVFVGGLSQYSGPWQSFIAAIAGGAVLFGILWVMQRYKIIVKV